MLKKIIFTSIFLYSSQSIMALDLEGVTSAAETVNEAKQTADNLSAAKEAIGTAANLKDISIADTAKEVVVEGAKGGVKGAAEGVTTGAIGGAKSGLNPF